MSSDNRTMRRISAFRGELGLKIRFWIPQVHTLCLREPCEVEIEEGEEALYPAAAETVILPRPPDVTRHGHPPDLGVERMRFLPEPTVRYGLEPEVVVCPRWRSYGSQKNWAGWPELVEGLMAAGVDVAAAGAPDSSHPVPCPIAWEHPRFLDASIEMIRAARLVVATDAGLAHLAVLCGTDLLIVTYRGKVAPGPVVASSGKVAREEYWRVRLGHYYREANHAGARIETVDGWESVETVIQAVEEW